MLNKQTNVRSSDFPLFVRQRCSTTVDVAVSFLGWVKFSFGETPSCNCITVTNNSLTFACWSTSSAPFSGIPCPVGIAFHFYGIMIAIVMGSTAFVRIIHWGSASTKATPTAISVVLQCPATSRTTYHSSELKQISLHLLEGSTFVFWLESRSKATIWH